MLMSDNGPKFVGKDLKWFLEELCIEHRFASVRHAHTNGQVNVSNKLVLNGLKKRIDATDSNWADG